MGVTLNKKIKKRKIDLIIPKGVKHDLIIPNYSNLGYNLIILKIMIMILLYQIFKTSFSFCMSMIYLHEYIYTNSSIFILIFV